MADPDRDPRNNPQPPAPKPVRQKTTTITTKPSYDWQRAAYGRYRRPGYSSRGDQRIKPSPLANRLRLGPENFTVSEEFLNNPEAQRQFRNRSTVLRMPQGQNQVEDIAVIPRNETFWENPQRVARYRQFIASAPPETELPSWLDVGAVNQAYDYFKSTNPGRPWYLWQPPQEDDPARVELANIPVPPPDAMLIGERERFYGPSWKTTADDRNVYAVDLATAQRAFAPEQLSMFPVKGSKVLVPATYLDQYVNGQQNEPVDAGMYQPQAPQDLQNGIPADVWEQLPWWQKVIIPVLPAVNTGLGVIGGGLAGLSMGGPLGAAVGAAAGGAMAIGAEKNKTLADLMMKLDVPMEYLERAMGVVGQLGASALEPDKYGAVGEILSNLPAAWEAGHLSLDVGFSDFTDDQITGWELGNPNPTITQVPDGQIASSWLLTEARRRIANKNQTGETTEEIWADISSRVGFAGEMRDMFGHMLMDPLNKLGDVTNAVGGRFAKVAGNVPLERAFKGTHETLDAMRQYGQSLRRLPPAEAARYGTVSRWIAGLDEAGNIIDLKKPRAGALDYLRGLDPKSRATEVLTTAVDGLQVALSDIDDPVQMVKLIHSIGKLEPGQVVGALDGSDLPRWFQSAEAQSVPAAIHDQLPKAQAMLDEWQITRPQATILQRVAEFMGVEPEKLIADLHAAKAADADNIFRVFMEKVQQRAQTGDAAAQRIVKALTSDQGLAGLDGRKLKQMAGLFAGENAAPLRPQEFKYRLMVSMTEGVDNWAAKWFDVKPAGWAVRMGNTIKKAQGLVLLGLNPTYVFNNAINNMVTLAWDGLLGFSTGKSRQKFLDELGFTPSRLRQGVAPSDIIEAGAKLGRGKGAYQMGQAIRKAAKMDKGTLAALDDFFSKGDKFAIFTGLSSKLEEWSSEMATVTAMRQFWDRSWREGVGFDRMPGDLRMALDAVQPGLADRVTKAIRRGKSRQAIEREIFSDLGKRSVRDVLGPQEAALMSHFPDVVDDLDAKVRAAETPEQVRSAFTDARAAVQRRAAEEIGRQVQTITTNAATRIQVEGGQAVLDIMDDIAGQRSNFWLEHFRKMDDVARQADALTGPARSALWQNALREADREWNTFLNIEGAKILGAFKGLGVSDATYAQITRNLTDMHDNWQAFFARRRELMDKFADAADGLTPEERTALWHQVNRELNADYVDALLEEDRLTGLSDEMFAKAYERQGQGLGDSARVWRKSVQDVRRQMAMAMVQYRAGDIPAPMLNVFGSILPQQVSDAIRVLNGGQPVFALDKMTRGVVQRRFYQDVYTPFIRQMLEASNANTPGAPVRPGIPQGQPIIPEVDAAAPAGIAPTRMREDPGVWQAVAELKSELAGVDAQGRPSPGARLDIIKWVKKHDPQGRRVKKFNEITPDNIRRAAEHEQAVAAASMPLPDGETAPAVDAGVLAAADDVILARDASLNAVLETPRGKTFLTRPIQMLPTFVRQQVEILARNMLSQLQASQGTVREMELDSLGNEIIRRKRDLPAWYAAIYDSEGMKSRKSKMRQQVTDRLTKIIAGQEDPLDELTQNLKTEIAYSLTNPAEPSLATMWWLGMKDAVAEIVNREFMDDASMDRMLAHFGDPQVVDDVAAYWVEWLGTQESGSLASRMDDLEAGLNAVADATPPKTATEPETLDTTPADLPNLWEGTRSAQSGTPVQTPAPAAAGADVPAGPVEPVRAPRGTADQLIEPPIQEANWEGWLSQIAPLFDRAEEALASPAPAFSLEGADAGTVRGLKAYLGQVYEQLNETKMGALRWGESKRDAALLNYSRRYGFDNVLGTVMPYEFWYTHSMLQWALRALAKPAMFANYARVKTYAEDAVEREGFPTRLRKKIAIPAPFLPEWMGGNIYIDPMRQLFPFETFARPWETLSEQKNQEQRRAEGILQEMVADESTTAEEAAQALQARSGPLWDQALAQARNETDQDIANPFDFAFMMSGPSLPVSIGYNLLMGRKDQIGQLPITRMIQATTGAMGIGGPRGVNIESGLRKAAGLPEVDAYEDYRVDRMLAGMAAEGSVDPDAALQAMIDRTGPAFEMAQRRVSQMGAWQYWGAPLSVDFFPEGEADQRQLKTEYDRAIAAWKDGDKQALTKFFDAYPEYETRMASFQEPEERLKKFLISEVWSAYRALPIIHQEQAREQLGDVFQDAFLNKETRSYNAITPQTLATWARAMKGRVPEAAGETPQMSLDLADDETAQLVQGFYTEKDKRFPGLSETLDAYYNLDGAQQDTYARQHPEIDRYFKWRTQWIASNPAAIPWLTSESSELAGLPIDVQGYVYNYRAEKDRRFPTIEKLQDEYFAILDEGKRMFPGIEGLQNQYFDYPKGSRERRALLAANPQLGQYWDWKEASADAYLNQHPELTKYWDWRKETAAMYPQAAPYILSDASLRKSILPEAEDWQPQISESIMQNLSPAMTRQLMGYLYAGQQLSTGAVMELTRVWKKAGSPGGDLETWLESIQ